MSQVVVKFKEICAIYREKAAFVFAKGGKLEERSFGELEAEVESAAAYLRQMGVCKGDRLLAFATPSYDLCVFMLAGMYIGASIMYVDSWAKQDRLKNAFNQYRPHFILVSKTTAKIRFFLRELYKIKNILYVDKRADFVGNDTGEKDSVDISEDTVALLTLTTGSTGKPKAAIRTHRHLYEQLMLVCNNMEVENKDEYVLTTSYMYVFSNILNGFTTVLPELRLGKSSPRRLDRRLSVFAKLPISAIVTTPDFCLSVSNQFPKLRRLYIGGAILTIHEAEKIYNKFKTSNIIYIYGATECNLITVTSLKDFITNLRERSESVLGEVAKGVQLRTNEKFEIMVSSKAMLDKYLVQSDLTNKEADENNVIWHKTGDAGELKDGKLFYYGRCDKRLTFNTRLYSSQLEQRVCLRFPSVEKCAVCVDSNDSKKLWIFVVCKNSKDFDSSEIYSYVHSILPEAQIAVKRIGKMPCDVKHHTKINYNALQKLTKRKIWN